MIKIEEVADDASATSQKPNHEEASEQAENSRLPSSDAQPSAGGSTADQSAEVAQQSSTEEQDLEAVIAEAEQRKQDGNALFKHGQYTEAADRYGDGLIIAPEGQRIRAILFANRAACYLELQQYKEAVNDCSAAIDIDGTYLKAWHRRAKAHESLDDMDRALKDAQKAQELSPEDPTAAKTIARLQPLVAERQEKMKDEMLGKLKELGNTVLGKFGMSLDNFKAEKDPNTGSYSINFKQ